VKFFKRREAKGVLCMSLKAIVENLDGLSAEIVKEYKKGDDGKYRLDVIAVDGLELAEVSKLQSALSKERENARAALERVRAFEDIDPVKARDALQKVGEMANWTPEQKVKEQIDAVRTQLLDAHGKEKTKLDERLTRLNEQLESAMITSVATQAIAEQKGSIKLLMPHVERQTRLREIDGKFVVEVIGADGNPRLVGSQGTAMTISELVAEMKTQNDFASAFEGTNASGSGATGGGANKQGGVHVLSRADAKDPQKYRAAKEAATKAGSQIQIADK
jgi:hypothetical protein